MKEKQVSTNLPVFAGEHRSGWPWEQVRSNRAEHPTGSFPSFTIVTPSYNQGGFIEETIRSVLLQRYPLFEYFVYDAGSRDATKDILKHYSLHLDFWAFEPDDGQSDAINKGWRRATGDYFLWLNSDDLLCENALWHAAEAIVREDHPDVLAGSCLLTNGMRYPEYNWQPKCMTIIHQLTNWVLGKEVVESGQPSTYVKKAFVSGDHLVKEDLHFVMDWELWLRLAVKGAKRTHISRTLSEVRRHTERKTTKENYEKILAESKWVFFKNVKLLHKKKWHAALLIRIRWYVQGWRVRLLRKNATDCLREVARYPFVLLDPLFFVSTIERLAGRLRRTNESQ